MSNHHHAILTQGIWCKWSALVINEGHAVHRFHEPRKWYGTGSEFSVNCLIYFWCNIQYGIPPRNLYPWEHRWIGNIGTPKHAHPCKCTYTLIDALGVSWLTFSNISTIFSRNLCIAEIILPTRISSWNFVRVPLGTRAKFQLDILTVNVISGILYLHEIILEI